MATEPQTTTPKYFRTDRAEAYLGLAKGSLRKLRAAGTGPKALKLGHRTVIYEIATLDQWAQSHALQAAPAASAAREGNRAPAAA